MVSELVKSNDSSCFSPLLHLRTVTFPLGKKDGFSSLTEFQALSVGRSSTGHVVQAATKAAGTPEIALAAGWLASISSDLPGDGSCSLLVKKFITFLISLILRQLPLTWDCHLQYFPVALIYLSQFHPLVPHEVESFPFSNEGPSNVSMLLSGCH